MEVSENHSMSSSSSSFEVRDTLADESYLEYVNEILMTEELDDCLPAVDDAQASYKALMRSFYDLIGQPLPLHSTSSQQAASAAVDTSRGFSAASSLDTSFEELQMEADYASLYNKMLTLSVSSSNEGKAISTNDAKRSSSRPVRKSAQIGSSVVVRFVDLRELLVNCAQAVGMGDVKRANQMLHDLYHVHGVSPQGNSLQRIAHYFCDALVARLAGTGWQRYRVIYENKPSIVSFLKASRIWYQVIPIYKLTYFLANQNILKVAAGAARLHILDFGIEHGMQWPCLINALADQDAGPPSLVITAIENPKEDEKHLEKLKATGRRLAAYANRYQVPFQFHSVVSEKWESIDRASFQLQDGEVLMINCVKYLHLLADETVDSSSNVCPRQKLLMHLRNLNPHLLLMADITFAGSSPFFVPRFREAVHYFYNIQDMLDSVCWEDPDRLLMEQKFCSSCILSIVACEGAERVRRPETFKQWDSRLKRAGFELLVIPSDVLSRAKLFVKQHYHSDFMVVDDAKEWLLLGWKGRVVQAMSAWRPSCIVK